MRLVPLLTAAALTLGGGLTAVTAPTAAAHCPEMGNYYKVYNIKKSKLLSNLRSDYITGPATISYSSSRTGSTTFGGSLTVGAEAGVIFAKASVQASVKLDHTWSKTATWTYSKSVPKGKRARLVMWHESRSFYVKMTRLDHNCKPHISYMHLNAPRRSNINFWDLQYG